MAGRTLYNPRRYEYLYHDLPSGIAQLSEMVLSFEHNTHQHAHAEWQVLAVLEGSTRLAHDAERWPLGEGGVAVIPPEWPHQLEPAEGALAVRLIDLRYRVAMEDPLDRHLNTLAGVRCWQAGASRVRQIGAQLRQEVRSNARPRLACIMSLVWQLLIGPDEPSPRRDDRPIDPRIAAAINAIREGLHSPFSAEELAATLSISASQLRRLFQKHLHTTPIDYQLQMRIEQAKLWLRMTDRPAGDIARNLGFPNQSHFSRVFRARVGRTPLDYRRRRDDAST